MNFTSQNNENVNANGNAAATSPTPVPYRSTLHPILRSLWNIPHVIRIPDPMPAPPDVLKLLQQQLTRRETQLAALDFENDAHKPHIASHKFDISILKHKIEELLRVFPDLNPTAPVSAIPPIPPISPIPPIPNISPTEPGKTAQPSQPQQNSPRNEPGIIPEQPGIKPELPGTNAEKAGKIPEQPGNSDQPIPNANAPQNTATSLPQEDPDAPPKIQSNDEEFVAAATDLHYQRKGRSPFDKLSPQDQAIIIDLFEKFTWQTVLKTIAQPDPIGFNLKVGKTALYDFQKRYEKRRKQQNVQANLELLNKSSDPTHAFAQMFERAIQTKALTIASDPQTSLNTFDALVTTLNKHRKQTLAERKQLHAEKTK